MYVFYSASIIIKTPLFGIVIEPLEVKFALPQFGFERVYHLNAPALNIIPPLLEIIQDIIWIRKPSDYYKDSIRLTRHVL